MRRAATLLALLLTACSGVAPSDVLSPAANAPDPTTTTVTTTVTLPPRAPAPYRQSANEPVPELKQAAADAVLVLANYGPADSSVDAARRRLEAAGLPARLADGATALLVAGAQSSAEIVYAQFGGYALPRAAVMVVMRQRLLVRGEVSAVSRTIDVRLYHGAEAWAVEEIPSMGGDPVPIPPGLSERARRVLDNPRVELPDSARWDILAGRIADRVLDVLAYLGERYRVRVAVLASGHPPEVFATSRTSNHTVGRAVDVWALDGPVVDQRGQGSPLHGIVEELLRWGVTELGSPFDPDGPGAAAFTDLVHQDHLHLGFRAG